MSGEHKLSRLSEQLREVAAEFIERHSNRTSLITVTRVIVSPNQKRVEIYLSVLPETSTRSALAFIERQRDEFYDFLKKKSRLRIIPEAHFVLDLGEKNRQRIDELSEEVARLRPTNARKRKKELL